MREKTNVFYHVFKKSVWMIRNSPRWLSIRVAYSNSLKYSSRLPMSSVNSSKRSCGIESQYTVVRKYGTQRTLSSSSLSHASFKLLPPSSIPRHPSSIPSTSHQPYQSSPQADHMSPDAPQDSQRVQGNATPGYARLSDQ